MKKIVSVLLAMLVLASTVCAGAATPDFLTEVMTNYTADYDFSMTFDNSKEVVALLDEVEFPEEISYVVNIESLLRTLLSFDGKMHLQSDISSDYSKVKMGLTAESAHDLAVNGNLNIGVDAKMGMWMNMDLSNSNSPVFDIVYAYPFLNKYMKINGANTFEEAGMLDMFKAMFNKEYMTSMQTVSTDMFMRYATVKGSGNKYTISMDNDAFIGYINETLLMIPAIAGSMTPEDEYDSYLELPSVEGWQILGEDGYECEVVLSGGKIKTEKIKVDVSVDLKEIYTSVTGSEWEYESDGTIDFTISMNADVSNIGKTKVDFPVLTEENSFTFEDMGHEYISEEEATIDAYPHWYVDGYSEELPVIDGQIYVPLRQTIETAFEEEATIDYDHGKITMTSDYFNGYKTMVISIDSNSALMDGKEHLIMKPVLIDGKTYVSNTVFTELFGWEFMYATHDLITDEYYYTFYTQEY